MVSGGIAWTISCPQVIVSDLPRKDQKCYKRREFAYPCGRFAEGSLLQTERFLQNFLEGRFLSAAKEWGGGLEGAAC
jgi:hypothetical protein